MPDKKKSNHIFLPILDFTSNSLYINASRDLPSKSRDCFDYYGFDQLDDNNPRHYSSPHKIHRSWCGTKKARFCNCRPEANLGNKALVRIECTVEHLAPIVDLVAEAQLLGATPLAIDILECLSYQRSLPAKERSLALTYPVLSTAWNRQVGRKTYIHTRDKKVDELLENKIKELKQLVRTTQEENQSGNTNAEKEAKQEEAKIENTAAPEIVNESPTAISIMEDSASKKGEESLVNAESEIEAVTRPKSKSTNEKDKPLSGKTRFTEVLAHSRRKLKSAADHNDIKNIADMAVKGNKKKDKLIHFGIQLIDPSESAKSPQAIKVARVPSRVKSEVTKTGLPLTIPAAAPKTHRPYFPSQNVYGKHNAIYRPIIKAVIVNTVFRVEEDS